MRSRYYKDKKYIEFSHSLRGIVSKPVGTLYKPDKIINLINKLLKCKSKGYIASVGDRVTYTLINHNMIPDIGVIDGKEMRRKVSLVDIEKFNLIIYVENKPGLVNIAIYDIIRKNLASIPILIYVDGEEDLVGFPVIFALPIGSCMIYGQPGEGIVYIEIDRAVKYRAMTLLGLKKLD